MSHGHGHGHGHGIFIGHGHGHGHSIFILATHPEEIRTTNPKPSVTQHPSAGHGHGRGHGIFILATYPEGICGESRAVLQSYNANSEDHLERRFLKRTWGSSQICDNSSESVWPERKVTDH